MARFSILAAGALAVATQLADARQTRMTPFSNNSVQVSWVDCAQAQVESTLGDKCIEVDLQDSDEVSGYQFEVTVDGQDANIVAVGEAPEAFTVSY